MRRNANREQTRSDQKSENIQTAVIVSILRLRKTCERQIPIWNSNAHKHYFWPAGCVGPAERNCSTAVSSLGGLSGGASKVKGPSGGGVGSSSSQVFYGQVGFRRAFRKLEGDAVRDIAKIPFGHEPTPILHEPHQNPCWSFTVRFRRCIEDSQWKILHRSGDSRYFSQSKTADNHFNISATLQAVSLVFIFCRGWVGY